MVGNRVPKKEYYTLIWKKTRLRGRPRNRWQHEVREDGRIVGGEGWHEKVYNREEWKESSQSAQANGMSRCFI
jgi:hypothetical protein